jgi:SAM-dependent methyltransferase
MSNRREETVKQYYKEEYHAQYNLSKANIKLYNEIIGLLGVDTIFEFGCNVGRHLNRLNNFGYTTSGIDINSEFIEEAISNGLSVKTGDESFLVNHISDDEYDLSFTNSVICHMPPETADIAITELKRISKKYVIMCECITKDHKFWWVHDYKKYGFTELLTVESHLYNKNDAIYKIFIYKK